MFLKLTYFFLNFCVCALVTLSDAEQKIEYENITLRTWHHPPYHNSNKSNGIIFDMIVKFKRRCNHYNETVDKPLPIMTRISKIHVYDNYTRNDIKNLMLEKPSDGITVIASSTNANFSQKYFRNEIFLKTKMVVIVRTRELLLLVKLWTGIQNCFILIHFAVVATILMAALVWLFEHRTNEAFPKSFGEGLWESFWFSLITIATVGYGDKVPKQFITRIFCIIWILFGMLLMAMITATLIEEISKKVKLDGEDIAILGTKTAKNMVKQKLNGKAKIESSYEDLFYAVKIGKAKAGLIDANIAGVHLSKDFKVERIISGEVPVYMYISSFYKLRRCMEKEDDALEDMFQLFEDNVKAKYTTPVSPTKFTTRAFDTAFDDSDGGLIMYTTIIAGCLIAIAIVAEGLQWITRRRNKKCDQIENEDEHLRRLEQELKELKKKIQIAKNKCPKPKEIHYLQ